MYMYMYGAWYMYIHVYRTRVFQFMVITSHALSTGTLDVVGLLAEMFRRVTCTCSVTRF